jgi:hypothetical protein
VGEKRITVPPTLAIVVLLAVLDGMALASWDKYASRAHCGLAFSEFRDTKSAGCGR